MPLSGGERAPLRMRLVHTRQPPLEVRLGSSEARTCPHLLSDSQHWLHTRFTCGRKEVPVDVLAHWAYVEAWGPAVTSRVPGDSDVL